MLAAALFTTAKTGKQPKRPPTGECTQTDVDTREYCSAPCNNTGGLSGHYARGDKSDRKPQSLYDMVSLKCGVKNNNDKTRIHKYWCSPEVEWERWAKWVQGVKRYELLVLK